MKHCDQNLFCPTLHGMTLRSGHVCLNGHLLPYSYDKYPDLCPKCRASVISECQCGHSIDLYSSYRPSVGAVRGRDYCGWCGCLYPWSYALLMQPSNSPALDAQERNLLRFLSGYPQEPSRAVYQRSFWDRVLGRGVPISDKAHPFHDEWKAWKRSAGEFEAAVIRRKHEAYDVVVQRMSSENWWHTLSGAEFERAFVLLLMRRGYMLKHTGGPGDAGVDVVLQTKKGTVLVQCKAHGEKIGPAAVRDLYGTLVHRKAEEAWLVSLQGFSEAAYEFAADKPIKLLTISTFVK